MPRIWFEQNETIRMVSLDERDHALLLSLLEHKVLTTHQIKSLFFRSFRRCQHRMKELRDLGSRLIVLGGEGFRGGEAAGVLVPHEARPCARSPRPRTSASRTFPGSPTTATGRTCSSPTASG